MSEPVAAALLREARARAGLSQAELARRAGVSRSVLSVYESGRREPGSEALSPILAATGYRLGLQATVRDLDVNVFVPPAEEPSRGTGPCSG